MITCNNLCTIEVELLVLFLFLLWLCQLSDSNLRSYYSACLPEPFQCLHHGKRCESVKAVLALAGTSEE